MASCKFRCVKSTTCDTSQREPQSKSEDLKTTQAFMGGGPYRTPGTAVHLGFWGFLSGSSRTQGNTSFLTGSLSGNRSVSQPGRGCWTPARTRVSLSAPSRCPERDRAAPVRLRSTAQGPGEGRDKTGKAFPPLFLRRQFGGKKEPPIKTHITSRCGGSAPVVPALRKVRPGLLASATPAWAIH